jgi:hypothetical protein
MSSRLSIEDARRIAREMEGECLSDVYINCTTHLWWRCKYGHLWEATLNNIRSKGHWCPDCGGSKKLSIEVAKRIGIEREGECLSDVYINSNTPLIWRCQFGHTWKPTLTKVKNAGTWCPDCGGRKQLTIEVAQQIAIERGGRCLSQVYINNESPLQWECAEMHVWTAALRDVKDGGTWCATVFDSDFTRTTGFKGGISSKFARKIKYFRVEASNVDSAITGFKSKASNNSCITKINIYIR